jgi:hypothetical protein
LWLVGIAELPLIVAEMLSAVEDPVQALVHAPPERADQFDTLGCVRPEVWRDVEIPIDDEVLSVADRPSDQADEVVRILGHLEDERAADEITIGVLDDSLVPYIEQRLGAYGVASRYAAGTPLARTGPYRLLTAIADYLDGRSWPAAAALLRHPDVGAWIDATEAPEIADRFFEKHIPTRLLPDRPRSRRSEDLSRVRQRLERESGIERLTGSRRLSEWMPDLLGLLEGAYGEAAGAPRTDAASTDAARTGAARTEANRRIVESCLRIRDSAAELFGLPGAVDPSCEAPTALRILLSESSSQAVPSAADERAVELVGWLEVHLDDAPVLVLTGLNEPHLPESIGGDPFLPDSLRTALGLEDNEKRYARDAYRLLAILHSRPVCRLVTGRRDASGDPLRPSRLLFATDGQTAAERLLSFVRGSGTDGKRTLPALGIRPAATSGFRLPPETEIAMPEPPQPFPVTHFKAILQDPFRWALERGMGLREVHDLHREMDGALLGTVAHEVLHRFGVTPEASSTDPAVVYRCLSQLLDTDVEARFGGGISGATEVQVEQLRWRLEAFAGWQAAWVTDGWRIVATEASTPKGGAALDVDGTEFLLSGRIDRIDHHAARGRWAILDYKAGENGQSPESTHRKHDAWVDLQLPLYRHLLPALEGVDWGPGGPPGVDSPVDLGYLLLPKKVEDVKPAFADWDESMLQGALETARDIVRFLRENQRVTMSDTPTLRGRWDPLARLFGQRLLEMADPEDEGEGE